jgi:NAD(P)-dependent dehydrogenase (short-subunit alcohol dehydrogenase family)
MSANDSTTWASASPVSGEFLGWSVAVTGGSSGIGLAASRRFRERGARVVSLDLVPPNDVEGVAWQRCDVVDDVSVREAVEATLQEIGDLDVLVNDAGIGVQGTVEERPETADEEWRKLFEVNVFGVMRVTRAALPSLRRSTHASIVNVASFVVSTGVPRRAAYSASKGAVFSLTRALAADHLLDGIRVNSVSPGTVDTPWVERLLDATGESLRERTAVIARQPHGRLVTSDEVAAVICYLSGPDAGSTTGADLVVDGGILGTRIPAPAAESDGRA